MVRSYKAVNNQSIHTCTEEDASVLAGTIQRSFQDVADRFGLTRENAPRHPSNYTVDWVLKDMNRGVVYFVLKDNGRVVGCAALEAAGSDICYLERLAVLPEHRKQGFGKTLVDHILSEARVRKARSVNIGIIAEQTELKDWYRRIGFVEGESKDFPHLPFRVTFMSYEFV